jgi:glucose/arabinose dehydrogenase
MLLTCITCIALGTTSPFTIDYLSPPKGEVLEVGGMGFMSDGDMVVSTRRGQVWRISNPNAANPKDATFTLICEGLHEGMGLAVVNDEIFVAQRCELSKLVDLDGDEIIDEIQTITQDWGMSGNYHEFGFGLPVDEEGNMYVSLNVGFWNPHWWHGKSRAPYRGWVLKVTPDGKVEPIAGGFRSPAGMGLLEDGTLLVTDNQGDWMPVCPVYAVKKGAFYGHPASLRWYDDQPDTEPSDTQPPEVTREHPVLWLPYQWSRSTGNVILDSTDGPFRGQYLIAELTNGQILRANFETIDGIRQGACWLAHQRVGSAYHIEYGRDGTLYAGITNRGWGGLAPGSGVARIKYNGNPPLEMTNGHLLKDGFEITFSKPLTTIPTVSGTKYDYNWWWEYGSPIQNLEDLEIQDVSLSDDGRSAIVSIENLEAGTCVMLKIGNATSDDGSTLRHNEMSYTINKMPGGDLRHVAKQVTPPIERGERVEGWLYLTWADAFDVWTNNGVIACNAELDINNPTQFVISDGPNALVARAGNSMQTHFKVSSGALKLKYMLAESAKAEIQLPNGGVVALADDDEGGYLGSGIWHELEIKFSDNPRVITSVEINSVRVASDVLVNNRVATPLPIEIRGLDGDFAFGDVRLQHFSKDLDKSWRAFKYDKSECIEQGVSWQINDAGELVVYGSGSLKIPIQTKFESIRLDTKLNGSGTATITIGDIILDIASTSKRKTGSINNHPINANLVDQHEWCTIEVRQDKETVVLLNGVELTRANDIPSLECESIVIKTNDAKVHIRRVFVQ